MQQRIALPKRLQILNQVLPLLLRMLRNACCTPAAWGGHVAGQVWVRPVMQASEQEVGRPTATSDLPVGVGNGTECLHGCPSMQVCRVLARSYICCRDKLPFM